MAEKRAGSLARRVIAIVVPFTNVIARLRGPLVVAVAGLLLLGIVDQVQEIYVVLARDLARMWLQAILAALALMALSIYLWSAAAGLLDDEQGPAWLFYSAPALIALLPITGV